MGRIFPKSRILTVAVVLVFANISGVIRFTNVAHAFPVGTQLTTRSVQMSDSRIGTTAGATTSFQVNFKPGSATYTVKGIVVDFCNDSPVVGNTTCTLPPGFTAGASPTVTTTGAVGTVTDLGGTWTASSVNSGRTLKITNSTGVSINPANANPYAFTITNVTNPTALGSFYARIITYTLDTGDIASYAAGSEGSTNAKDYGSVALSTANVISITARVPEQLQFCVSGGVAPIPSACGTVTVPNLSLGHPAGAGAVVDNTATDVANAYMQVSTNAQAGVNIRMRNLNTCSTGAGGLQRVGAAVCDIPAVNAGSATTPTTMPFGTAAFGMSLSAIAAGFTAQAPYSTAGSYGMDTTTVLQNVTSTYGDIIETSAAPSANANSTLTFAATASATTPAGLYQATIVLVCVGQF
jgi:hypothetical protein